MSHPILRTSKFITQTKSNVVETLLLAVIEVKPNLREKNVRTRYRTKYVRKYCLNAHFPPISNKFIQDQNTTTYIRAIKYISLMEFDNEVQDEGGLNIIVGFRRQGCIQINGEIYKEMQLNVK